MMKFWENVCKKQTNVTQSTQSDLSIALNESFDRNLFENKGFKLRIELAYEGVEILNVISKMEQKLKIKVAIIIRNSSKHLKSDDKEKNQRKFTLE